MAEQLKLCPGCGGEPFVWGKQYHPRMNVECSECSFKALTADWQRRTPGLATKAILDLINGCLNVAGIAEVYIDDATARAFHAEWSESPEMKKAAASAN